MENESFTTLIETEKGTFCYDYEKLSMERILQAETLFRLHEKLYQAMPATPDELKQAVERQLLKSAYAAILMKLDKNGEPEEYRPANNPAYEALSEIKGRNKDGKLYIEILKECKSDFFIHCGILSSESIQALSSLTRNLNGVPVSTLMSALQQTIAEFPQDEQPGSSSDSSITLTEL